MYHLLREEDCLGDSLGDGLVLDNRLSRLNWSFSLLRIRGWGRVCHSWTLGTAESSTSSRPVSGHCCLLRLDWARLPVKLIPINLMYLSLHGSAAFEFLSYLLPGS